MAPTLSVSPRYLDPSRGGHNDEPWCTRLSDWSRCRDLVPSAGDNPASRSVRHENDGGRGGAGPCGGDPGRGGEGYGGDLGGRDSATHRYSEETIPRQ